MAKMDPKKRKFLKHLGLLGFGALIGLGIAHATSPSENEIIKQWSDVEIKSGRKRIWRSETEFKTELEPAEAYPIREGGLPFVKPNVCAYHIDDDADGIYEKSETVKYCLMPCKDICPVDAITKHEFSDPELEIEGKIMPDIDVDKCIGCTKCFRICGYNAIEWFNYRE